MVAARKEGTCVCVKEAQVWPADGWPMQTGMCGDLERRNLPTTNFLPHCMAQRGWRKFVWGGGSPARARAGGVGCR
eukprot:364763-Chlamydomonas_euryale.AAC.4